MPGMKLQAFKGMYPKISPELLPAGGATLAKNVKLYSGNLLPYRVPLHQTGDLLGDIPNNTKTLYFNNGWNGSAQDLDIVNITTGGSSPLRTYITGDGVPKVDGFELGLPIPDPTPTATAMDTADYQIISSGVPFARSNDVATIDLESPNPNTFFKVGDYVRVSIKVNLPENPTETMLRIKAQMEAASASSVKITASNVNNGQIKYVNFGDPIIVNFLSGITIESTIKLSSPPSQRAYVYTWLTGNGEESLPSSPTPPLEVQEGQNVTLTGLPTGAPTGRPDIRGIRIYRSVTSATGSSYLRLKTLWFEGQTPDYDPPDPNRPHETIEDGTFIDNEDVNILSIALPSQDWDAPHPHMIGLKEVHNNILVGFFNRELCFSFPNIPHAWPERYRLSLPYNIVAVEATQGSLLVLTDTYAYVVSGNDPSTMTAVRLNTPYGCLSKRSVVVLDNGVMWATHAGLALYQAGGGLVLATQASIDWDKWSEMYDLPNLSAWYYEGKYLACDGEKSFIFYPGQNEGFFVELDQIFSACHYREGFSELFFTVNGTDGLFTWDAPTPEGQEDTNLLATWCSQYFVSPEPKNYGATKFEFHGFNEPQPLPAGLPQNRGNKTEWRGLMFCLSRPYKDPSKTQCYIIKNPSKVKRLKSGFKDDTYQIKFYTQVEVRSCVAAETPLEVRIVP